MASKRHLEALDPVIFNKLPRLEAEPATGFPAGLCKSSPVPNPGSENHFNYKGSYFACPLQSPDSPEQPLARWSPAAAYLHYGTGAGSQPVPAEGPLGSCLLYRPESLGSRLQPPGAEKGKDSLMRELLMKPVAVNKAAPLAVPKPVYRAPVCFVDPRMALPLGPRAESLQQRPGDADWAMPAATPTGHSLHPGEPRSGTGLHKRGPHSDPSLPPLHPSLGLPAKEKVGSPIRKVPEVPSLSLEPWPKLQPPATSPVYRERPPLCYPHTHYPLPLHKAALLYHPLAPTMEAQPSALPGAYKGFGFVGSEEPLPSSYLKPQAPRSYFPSPLDTYGPRAAGTGAVASPPTKSAALPRDAEPPQPAGYLPSPGFAFSPSDAAVFGTFAGTEPGCKRHQEESPRRQVAARHNSAFQPVCAPEKVPRGSGGLTETPALQETPRGGPPAPVVVGKRDACKVKDAPKELIPPSPSASPPEGLKNPKDGEVSPSSPPMPVINNVFSLAPYRDYLEGTKGSSQLPFCREHLRGDTPPQNKGDSQEPKPKLVPQDAGSQEGSPGGVRSGDLAPEDTVLDLSLKKRLVKAGETQGPPGHVEGTLDGEGAEEEEGPGGKVGVGEGAKPQALPLLLEVGSGDKSHFQSSATFMFKKYKILRSLPPSTVPPPQASSPHTPQPSLPPPPPSRSVPTPPPRTPPTSPPASSPPAPPAGPQPNISALRGAHPDLQQPPLPEAPRAPAEGSFSLPRQCETPAPQSSAGQYFTTLHTWLCDVISCSVSKSSPELLQEWLKPTKGKEIWLAFQDAATLLTNLLSQLETFMFARKCPFPHVVRAGAVFIPIHVVKEKLFPKLPGASVDQVLQEHKVELRPTTLSEERHLRDLELKSCTSRMLKLLALKQLPEIYPDLLNLHWHNSIRQQLGR
uniref:Chromosome 15 open reading frame 39 n=1 Tax=Falco tinnunculus TaxID=100819 RepID=A0A8C4V351_FALTI